MWRKIGIAASAFIVLYALWLYFSAETPVPREGLVALPCELTWSVADVDISENTDIKAEVNTFVPIVGRLKGTEGRFWSHQCNTSSVGMYPDGILAPEPLPEEEHEMLMRDIRNATMPDAKMSERTNVVRMFVRCVPDLPSTPSAREKLPIVGLSVAVGVEGNSAFFAGLMKMPEEPGVYWVQLWCEFTENDTFSEFTPFTGRPVAEIAVTVTRGNSPNPVHRATKRRHRFW